MKNTCKNTTNATRRCNKPNNYSHINSYWASNQKSKSVKRQQYAIHEMHINMQSVRTMQHYNDIVDCEDVLFWCCWICPLPLIPSIMPAVTTELWFSYVCPIIVWLRASECGSVTSHGMGRWCSSQGWDSIALTALWLLLAVTQYEL